MTTDTQDTYRTRARTNPVIYGYISTDERFVLDYGGKIIGRVRDKTRVDLPRWSHVHGKYVTSYRVLMDDGVMRYGRSSPLISITLTAYVDQDRFNER